MWKSILVVFLIIIIVINYCTISSSYTTHSIESFKGKHQNKSPVVFTSCKNMKHPAGTTQSGKILNYTDCVHTNALRFKEEVNKLHNDYVTNVHNLKKQGDHPKAVVARRTKHTNEAIKAVSAHGHHNIPNKEDIKAENE